MVFLLEGVANENGQSSMDGVFSTCRGVSEVGKMVVNGSLRICGKRSRKPPELAKSFESSA